MLRRGRTEKSASPAISFVGEGDKNMAAADAMKTIDGVSCVPQKCARADNPLLPEWVVDVFFQSEEEAKAFIKATKPYFGHSGRSQEKETQ